MSNKQPIERITIRGFKSIRDLTEFPLRELNVLIGANGAGKSNFISYFRMLSQMVEGRLQHWTAIQGSADRIVSFGVKETTEIASRIEFQKTEKPENIREPQTNDTQSTAHSREWTTTNTPDGQMSFLLLDESQIKKNQSAYTNDSNSYGFTLEATREGGFIFDSEEIFFMGPDNRNYLMLFGHGHKESHLKMASNHKKIGSIINDCYSSIAGWKVYHVHDTSETASMRRIGSVHDDSYLRPDASNLAAFLYRLAHEAPNTYGQIRKTVRLAIPFFDDFILKPRTLPTEEQQLYLQWRQKNSDYTFWPSHLSDGAIRFICLVTALLQPDPPSTIIIDEPELGLHPYALTVLGALIRSASTRMQVIVSTQSVSLVNQFDINDLIIVERRDGASTFERRDEKDFKVWLEDYAAGELWEKNLLGGTPRS